MPIIDPLAEEVRFAVLRALYDRKDGAHDAGTLRTLYLRNHPHYTQAQVDGALALMETANLVRKVARPLPAAGFAWQLTLEGAVAYENS